MTNSNGSGPANHVLVVDDDRSVAESMGEALVALGCRATIAGTAREALADLGQSSYDLMVSDLRLPEEDGLWLLEQVRERYPEVPVILVTAYATVGTAVEAMRAGAEDYLAKPFRPEELRARIRKVLRHRELERENRSLRQALGTGGFGQVVAESRSMRETLDMAGTVATTATTVLLVGETGVGKEVVARTIHAAGARAGGPFVPVNCAAFPSGLLESELFGHERGAFTGAVASRRGAFEAAHGGTLFLDEVAEMDLAMQPKLLRALEEGRVKRVGSDQETRVDVRILVATNRDLGREVEHGRFRKDLYYRLNTVTIRIPPLRERPEDVVPLAEAFRKYYQAELKKPAAPYSEAVLDALRGHAWPGNVRELKNAVEHAVLFAPPQESIRVAHLPKSVARSGATPVFSVADDAPITLEELQRRYVAHVLELAGGNRQKAARILGVSAVTLWRWAAR